MTHGIEQCRHGTIVRQCRCMNDQTAIVPCPESCPEKDRPMPEVEPKGAAA